MKFTHTYTIRFIPGGYYCCMIRDLGHVYNWVYCVPLDIYSNNTCNSIRRRESNTSIQDRLVYPVILVSCQRPIQVSVPEHCIFLLLSLRYHGETSTSFSRCSFISTHWRSSTFLFNCIKGNLRSFFSLLPDTFGSKIGLWVQSEHWMSWHAII